MRPRSISRAASWEINWASPLTRRLTHAWFPWQGAGSVRIVDLVTGKRAVSTRGDIKWNAIPSGPGGAAILAERPCLSWNDLGTVNNITQIALGLIDDLVPTSPPATMVFGFKKRDSVTRNTTHVGANQDSPNTVVRMDLTLPFSDTNYYFDFSNARLTVAASAIPFAIQARRVFGFAVGRGENRADGMRAFCNGVKIGENTTTPSARTASSQNLCIFADLAATADYIEWDSLLLYSRALEDAELARITTEPLLVVHALGRRVLMPAVVSPIVEADANAAGTATAVAISGVIAGVEATAAGAATVVADGINANNAPV